MRRNFLLIGLVVLAALAAGYFALPDRLPRAEELRPRPSVAAPVDISLPLFVAGGELVCDVSLVWLPTIGPSQAGVVESLTLLEAVLSDLLALPPLFEIDGITYQNPLGYQAAKEEFPPLLLRKVQLAAGAAEVHLEGSFTGVGPCYDPLPALQLEAAGEQFPEIKGVRYFINGEPFDPRAIADYRGEGVE